MDNVFISLGCFAAGAPVGSSVIGPIVIAYLCPLTLLDFVILYVGKDYCCLPHRGLRIHVTCYQISILSGTKGTDPKIGLRRLPRCSR
jgi:hypothetical protein